MEQRFIIDQDLWMCLVENSQVSESPDIMPAKILLPWSDFGLLPFTEIEMSPAQLLDSSLVAGSEASTNSWDLGKRKRIARELLLAAQALSKVGVNSIIVSGEFTERLADPVSAEGYFEIDGSTFALPALHDYLSVLEPRVGWSTLLGRPAEGLVNLYPIFKFIKDGTILIAPTAPLERFHQNSEGRQKGVVRLTSPKTVK